MYLFHSMKHGLRSFVVSWCFFFFFTTWRKVRLIVSLTHTRCLSPTRRDEIFRGNQFWWQQAVKVSFSCPFFVFVDATRHIMSLATFLDLNHQTMTETFFHVSSRFISKTLVFRNPFALFVALRMSGARNESFLSAPAHAFTISTLCFRLMIQNENF